MNSFPATELPLTTCLLPKHRIKTLKLKLLEPLAHKETVTWIPSAKIWLKI